MENKKTQEIQAKTLYIITLSFLAVLLAMLTVLLILRKPEVAPEGSTTESSSLSTDQDQSGEEESPVTPDTGDGAQDDTSGNQSDEDLPEDPDVPDVPDIPEVEIPELPGENKTDGDNALPPVLPPDWVE